MVVTCGWTMFAIVPVDVDKVLSTEFRRLLIEGEAKSLVLDSSDADEAKDPEDAAK